MFYHLQSMLTLKLGCNKSYTLKNKCLIFSMSVFDLFIFLEVICLYFHVCHFYNIRDKIFNMYSLVSAVFFFFVFFSCCCFMSTVNI